MIELIVIILFCMLVIYSIATGFKLIGWVFSTIWKIICFPFQLVYKVYKK